jgi:hypothetical protein
VRPALVAVFGLLSLAQNDPDEIPFKALAHGDRFTKDDAVQIVVTTAKEFEDHWKKLYPQKPVPKIDFDKEAAVLLSLGVRPHGGYGVSVSRILRSAEAIRIEYRETLPDPGKKYIQALIHPFVVVLTAKPDRKVEFVKLPK